METTEERKSTMKEIISIVNRRGGVGKTITAHTIGTGLYKKGFKVLSIDLDSQCNLSFDLNALESKYNVLDVMSGNASAREAVYHTEYGDMLTATPDLSIAEKILGSRARATLLKENLEDVLSDYDYIIIDTPPSLDILTVNALTVSDSVIIPAQAEVHSMQGIGLLYDMINGVKKETNQALKIKGILITRYNGRAIISRDMKNNLEDLAAKLQTKVFETPIRECTALKESQAVQQSIFDYAPRSNAAIDYLELIKKIIG